MVCWFVGRRRDDQLGKLRGCISWDFLQSVNVVHERKCAKTFSKYFAVCLFELTNMPANVFVTQ